MLVFGLEGDEAVVHVVGQCVGNHGNYHDDVLAGLLHREEGDDVIGQVLPAESLEQNPADAQLQGQANQEATDKEEKLSLEVIIGLEDPIAVPQETVDDTQHITRNVGDTVGQFQLGVEQIEGDQSDERIQNAYHTVFEQLNARLFGFFLVYLHDNSFNRAKLGLFNELTKYFRAFSYSSPAFDGLVMIPTSTMPCRVSQPAIVCQTITRLAFSGVTPPEMGTVA